MVTFTHSEAGTAESEWERSGRLAATPVMDEFWWRGFDRLLVVAAHPDDETLAAAGLITLAAKAGLDVVVLVASLGEASHPESPTHSPDQLGRIRREELCQAMGGLAPAAVSVFLALDDGAVAARRTELEHAITRHCAPGPGKTLIVAPWRRDAHPDHEASGAAAAAAAESTANPLLEYPLWLWHWAEAGSPDVPWAALRRLNLPAPVLRAKEAAISAHRSQIFPLSGHPGDEVLLPGRILAHFRRPFEMFIDSAGAFLPGAAEESAWAAPAFDAIHRDGAEPWSAPESWYEERKRELTLAALPDRHYGSALELGCSTGVLTAALAERCSQVLGVDLSREAVRTAAARTRNLPGVQIRQLAVPGKWPEGAFDLIVMSETGYYLSAQQLQATLARSTAVLRDGGVLVACHWRHPIDGWPLDGADVHAALAATTALQRFGRYAERDFLLEVFVRVEAGTGSAG